MSRGDSVRKKMEKIKERKWKYRVSMERKKALNMAAPVSRLNSEHPALF